MAFAIFYNPDDLTGFQASITRLDISPAADRSLAQSLWSAGINTWATAPQAPVEYQSGDPSTRIIVINGRHQGKDLTLADLRALLYRQAGPLSAPILAALADDMGNRDGAKDPWP